MIAEDLVDRLSSEVGQRLVKTARRRRVRALSLLRECRVLVTRDGDGTWEEVFASPPTVGEIVARVGATAYVVSVRMKARTFRERFGFGIAAE
jgi:hypothetical protein